MVGKIIGNYQFTEELGYGSLGVVYRGQHIHQARDVVIKEIPLAYFPASTRVQLKARFRREAFIQAQLDHPGIVHLYESFAKGDNYYLVMEYIQAISLRELLESQGLPTPAQAVYLCKQALAALDYAHNFQYLTESDVQHKGVIHRDLKPANLLVDGRGKLKITDFGIVRMPDKQSMAPPSFRPGTTEYMSPEQLRGSETDARSDIYSLGVTFYEMLTGKLPSSRPTNSSEDDDRRSYINSAPTSILELRPEIGAVLASIFMRAILRDATERFQTAADFLKAIKDYERNNGVSETISTTLIEEPATEQPRPVMIAEIATKTEVPILNQVSIASLTSKSEFPSVITDDHQIDLQTEVEVNSLAMQPYNGIVTETSANKMVSANLFDAWENNPKSSRRTFIAMGVVAVVFGILISLYFQTKKQNAVERSASQAGSGVPTNAVPTNPAVTAPTPPSIQPEREISSGEIVKLQRAREFDAQGRYKLAMTNYEAYLRSGPNGTDSAAASRELEELRQLMVYVKAARAAFKRQNLVKARRNYSEALKLRPNSQMVRNGLFRARRRLSAEQETPKKVEESPPNTETKPTPPPG